MRESNFTFSTHNRACVCISSTLYDRRALDAPAASLPLVNSLTHLSYLTATSARIRESLSSDGGLERLVRILQNCANPTSVSTCLADVKGKGPLIPKRKARKSPFKAFADYDLLPSLEELRDLEESDVTGALLSLVSDGRENGYSYSIPPSLLLPPSLKARHLLYTYTLAFQCIVNIGVRGSESIRTRVVEAGALEVVVHVLERYLEEIERKRLRNQVEWHRAEQARLGHHLIGSQTSTGDRMMEEGEGEDGLRPVVVSIETPSPLVTAAPTPVRPRLTRINVVAASSAAADSLAPPSRVQTPDTILSIDDASLTGDDNGSSSGQENEETVMSNVTTTGESGSSAGRMPMKVEGSGGEAPVNAPTDENGDIAMSGPSSPVEDRSEAEMEAREGGNDETTSNPQPTPRGTQPRLPSVPSHRTPRAAHPYPHGARPRTFNPPSATPNPLEATPEPEGQLYFRDEDVLLALQLLAYLSKYPHVRAVFHSPPASPADSECDGSSCAHASTASTSFGDRSHPLVRPHSINIFSLAELFTHRPPSDDPFTPRLSNEVQYWACTIMRNACRKDEQREGIRQCANMNCGKWEQYAREFAKCRRCRRAKYCSKACQSASWGNGHKFWCHKQSADERSSRRRAAEPESTHAATGDAAHSGPSHSATADARRRRHRRTAAGGGDEEDEDEEDDLPPPPPVPTLPSQPTATTTPQGGPTARRRSGTIPTAHDGTTPNGGRHHHHHPLAQPATLPGLDTVGDAPMPLGMDEDQVAREMMLMGEEEGVRVQDA